MKNGKVVNGRGNKMENYFCHNDCQAPVEGIKRLDGSVVCEHCGKELI